MRIPPSCCEASLRRWHGPKSSNCEARFWFIECGLSGSHQLSLPVKTMWSSIYKGNGGSIESNVDVQLDYTLLEVLVGKYHSQKKVRTNKELWKNSIMVPWKGKIISYLDGYIKVLINKIFSITNGIFSSDFKREMMWIGSLLGFPSPYLFNQNKDGSAIMQFNKTCCRVFLFGSILEALMSTSGPLK